MDFRDQLKPAGEGDAKEAVEEWSPGPLWHPFPTTILHDHFHFLAKLTHHFFSKLIRPYPPPPPIHCSRHLHSSSFYKKAIAYSCVYSCRCWYVARRHCIQLVNQQIVLLGMDWVQYYLCGRQEGRCPPLSTPSCIRRSSHSCIQHNPCCPQNLSTLLQINPLNRWRGVATNWLIKIDPNENYGGNFE